MASSAGSEEIELDDLSSPAEAVGLDRSYPLSVTYARVAAVLALVVSLALVAVVVFRDVGFNVLNGWTIVLGLVACVVLARAENRVDLVVGAVVLSLGLTPALFGGFGLLYLPSVGLAVVAATQLKEGRRVTSPSGARTASTS
jgi:hypothetical protein